mmetsp:Transcript_51121/g.135388  ORF Transcript_51121/g.135388 Transcript_51121/m.135388 type:complete len:394 (+) Transcript_51121:2-1183(+)
MYRSHFSQCSASTCTNGRCCGVPSGTVVSTSSRKTFIALSSWSLTSSVFWRTGCSVPAGIASCSPITDARRMSDPSACSRSRSSTASKKTRELSLLSPARSAVASSVCSCVASRSPIACRSESSASVRSMSDHRRPSTTTSPSTHGKWSHGSSAGKISAGISALVARASTSVRVSCSCFSRSRTFFCTWRSFWIRICCCGSVDFFLSWYSPTASTHRSSAASALETSDAALTPLSSAPSSSSSTPCAASSASTTGLTPSCLSVFRTLRTCAEVTPSRLRSCPKYWAAPSPSGEPPGCLSAPRARRAFFCTTTILVATSSSPLVRLSAHSACSRWTTTPLSSAPLITCLIDVALMPPGRSSFSAAASSSFLAACSSLSRLTDCAFFATISEVIS